MNNSFYEIDKVSAFFSPNKIVLGKGVAAQLGQEVKALGGSKPLIVTDSGVVKAGLLTAVEDALKAEKIVYGIYDRVLPEPPARVVDESAGIIRKEGYDIVIGVGGGSSLDAAKGASLMATNDGKILDYAGIDLVPKKGLPKILIPTTAGTGSEVTRVFVITDETDNTKKVVYTSYNLTDVAIVDPMLTISLPPSVTADTGMDALVHAIETFVSMNGTPFSHVLAIKAIGLIAHHLPSAYAKGTNMEARYNMILAATLAGLAFTSGGLGAVHGLAYVLGTEYHMSHGRSNAIMLPHVMDYNKTGNLTKYALIAEAMGEDIEGLSLYEAAAKSVDAVRKLLNAVNLSYRLSDYGIPKEDLTKLVEGGMNQARLFVPNPKDLAEEDVKKIYEGAF